MDQLDMDQLDMDQLEQLITDHLDINSLLILVTDMEEKKEKEDAVCAEAIQIIYH